MKADQLVRAVMHVIYEVPRANTIVVPGDYFQLIDIRDFVRGDDHRPEGEERVDALRTRQITRVLAQHIQRGQIESSRIPEDDVAHMLHRHETAAPADDDAQLAFRIDIIADLRRRQYDLAFGLKHATGRLHKTAGFFGLHCIDIDRM